MVGSISESLINTLRSYHNHSIGFRSGDFGGALSFTKLYLKHIIYDFFNNVSYPNNIVVFQETTA